MDGIDLVQNNSHENNHNYYAIITARYGDPFSALLFGIQKIISKNTELSIDSAMNHKKGV